MEKKVVKTRKEKVVIPAINEKENYFFLFNDTIPEKELRNQKHLITGELVNIFLKQGYGILC